MSDEQVLHCPVDNSSLVRQHHGEGQYHACRDCRGLWIPRTYLLALKRRAVQQLKRLEVQPLPAKAHSTTLKCPECTLILVPRIHEHVPIDVCAECRAVWLDGDEILQIAKVAQKEERRIKTHRERDQDYASAASVGGSWNSSLETHAAYSAVEAIGWMLWSIFD